MSTLDLLNKSIWQAPHVSTEHNLKVGANLE